MCNNLSVTVIGHPNAQIGMGAHVRSTHRALRAAGINSSVLDIYSQGAIQNSSSRHDFAGRYTSRLTSDVNIFCINGDEILPVLKHLKIGDLSELGSYNIIYPMWELPSYPDEWSELLHFFDEVWAPSIYIQNALTPALGRKVKHMSIACEVRSNLKRTRRFFGIPEDAFAFLVSFDFSSYMDRKNPFLVIEAFKKLKRLIPANELALVIKVHRGETRPEDYFEFNKEIQQISDIILIDATIDHDEVISLISLCDVYMSLHRAEGFGLGIAEAMCLGRPSVCTGWSGNLDFCDNKTSQLVDFKLVPVLPGQYPHWHNQVWADADIGDAVEKMKELVLDDILYQNMRMEGLVKIGTYFTNLAIGMRYRTRLDEIGAISGDSSVGRVPVVR